MVLAEERDDGRLVRAGRRGRRRRGGAATTKRVTASATSWMSSARTTGRSGPAANEPASAASYVAVGDVLGGLGVGGGRRATRRAGRSRASQRRHCGCACGWDATVLMSSSAVPGRTSSANDTGGGSRRRSAAARRWPARPAWSGPSPRRSSPAPPRRCRPRRGGARPGRPGRSRTGRRSARSAARERVSSAASVKVPSRTRGRRSALACRLRSRVPRVAGAG